MADEETVTVADNADDAEIATPETEIDSENTSTEDAASDAVDKEKEETTENVEKPKPDLKQRKIAKQARELREMKRRNAQLTTAIEEQSKAPKSTSKAPKIEDFEDMASYLDARDEYRDSKRETKAEPKTETQDDYADSREDMRDVGIDKYEDFEDVVFSQDVKITKEMADAIFEIEDSDLQADVAYFLGKNPKEASRIARLSERRQIAEVAKLEMKIVAKPEATQKVSKAPKPIKPVGGSKTANDEIKGVESYESFVKKRNKQLGR